MEPRPAAAVTAGMLPLLTLACPSATTLEQPAPPAPPEETYADVVARVEARRVALAARWAADPTPALRDEARAVALAAVRDELLPAWIGTGWDFHGVTRTPRDGEIACGYFVTTVLVDAGFQLERVELARLPSEHLALTLAPPSSVRRWRGADQGEVAAELGAWGDGLYVAGLDQHTGLLVVEGGEARFCDSWPGRGVACEEAGRSVSFASSYRVVARLLGDGMMEAWLEGRAIPTR